MLLTIILWYLGGVFTASILLNSLLYLIDKEDVTLKRLIQPEFLFSWLTVVLIIIFFISEALQNVYKRWDNMKDITIIKHKKS